MTSIEADSRMTKCIACRETILQSASICRYCRTSQTPAAWGRLATILKWSGGIVTVISLVIGSITLSGYFQEWLERRNTVTELVEAADWLIKTENYSQAWKMYDDALQLSPGSPTVFKAQLLLSKTWLRDFRTDKKKADNTLLAITSVLFRGLKNADNAEKSTLLAHVGWAQIIRKRYSIPVFIDVDKVFQEALQLSPENVYANAMSAYWLMLGRPMTVDDIIIAQSEFSVALSAALKDKNKTAYVRRLQFKSIVPYSYGYSDSIEQTALRILLQASYSMMLNNEAKPHKNFRYRILDAYGSMGNAEHAEATLAFLPAADHLAVYKWLLDDMEYGGNAYRTNQTQYLLARLTEASGDTKAALKLYQPLLQESDVSEKLDKLVYQAIKRLTGKLPQRALARTYSDDPIDEKNLRAFHIDTLINFDPMWIPDNFDQAIEYFETAINENNEKFPDLIRILPDVMVRVRNTIKRGDEIERLNAYTTGFHSGHHDNARNNLISLSYLYARALISVGKLDKAIAELGDVATFAGKLNDDWNDKKAWIDYELARTYAIRAQQKGDLADIDKALNYLNIFIKGNGVNGEFTSWAEIKGNAFKSLRDSPSYKALIRGR